MHNIPTDVVDEVFRLLRPFRVPEVPAPETPRVKEALHACTLVSRDWRALAQPHLFDNVYYSFMNIRGGTDSLRIKRTEARWGRSSAHKQWLPLKTFSAFYEFLRDSPALARCIHRLSTVAVFPGRALRPENGTTESVPLAALIGLLQLLPSLQELHLCDLELDVPRGHQFTPSSGRSLVELGISYGALRLARPVLAGILGCFKAIRKLDVNLYIFDQSDPPSDAELANSIVPSGRATVEHLAVAIMTDPRTYNQVLSTFLDLGRVASIAIFPSWRLWTYQSLVDAVSPGLREATVTVRPGDDIAFPDLTISFASCYELQRLTINASVYDLLEPAAPSVTSDSEHAAVPGARIATQLEPSTRLLAATGLQRADFRHFSELKFNLDIGLDYYHGDRMKSAPWRLSDVPCEAVERLDSILYDIARRIPSKKIIFRLLGMECWPGAPERGVRSCECTGEVRELVVGADVFLGRLFPWLRDHDMITSIGPSRVMLGL